MFQSAFKMKANLKQKEPLYLQQWTDKKLVSTTLAKNFTKKPFIVHDGPPYANGPIHLGHALNKILKDFIVRDHIYQNHYSSFICGWDNHGLPIEKAVLAQKKINPQINPNAFRKACRTYGLKEKMRQQKQLSRLGLFVNWEKTYSSIDFDYEMRQLDFFATLVKQNLVYRALKPVQWSCSNETALADAEIEYVSTTTDAIYVSFTLSNNPQRELVIWTTTPWTIMANQFLAVSAVLKYVVVQVDSNEYIIANDALARTAATCGWKSYKIVATYDAEQLCHLKAIHPLTRKETPIFVGHHVTSDVGTGVVHCAAAFGEDDFLIAQKHHIDPFIVLNKDGTYNTQVADKKLVGVYYKDANPLIMQKLTQTKALVFAHKIKHDQAVDWRSKKPLIYYATWQWFIKISTAQQHLPKIIADIKWYPRWGQKQMTQMWAQRRDWCFSRQRCWGLPIIAFYDQHKQLQVNAEILQAVYAKFKAANTVDIWYSEPADFFLPEQYQNQNWTKEQDTMDIWLDSSMSHLVLADREQWELPFDVVLEGNDQFRGWFNASLFTSWVVNKQKPFHQVITHGFINDAQGKKMSKSQGNVIDPLALIANDGADVLRLWIASNDYASDLRFSTQAWNQTIEQYRRIRNTVRFCINNLMDYNHQQNAVAVQSPLHQWIIFQTNKLAQKVQKYYANYEFNLIIKQLNNWIINDLSSFYFEYIKDILYLSLANDPKRREAQTVLFYVCQMIVNFVKPILVFLVAEINDCYPLTKELIHSTHYFSLWDKTLSVNEQFWQDFWALRKDCLACFEQFRQTAQVHKINAVAVTICLHNDYKHLLDEPALSDWLMFGKITWTDKQQQNDYKTSSLTFEPLTGVKCQRCWKIVTHYKTADLCERCAKIVSQWAEDNQHG